MMKSIIAHTERHIIVIAVLFVTDFLTLLNTSCLAITPEDLIQILSEQRQPKSGRVTFERHLKNLEIKEPTFKSRYGNLEVVMKVRKANAEKLFEDSIVFQVDRQRFKLHRRDLRDVQRIMDEYQLPQHQHVNVDQTSIQILQRKFSVIYSELAKNIHIADKVGELVDWQLDDQCRQGIFSADFLREDFIGGLEIDKVSVGNIELLRLRAKLIHVDDPSKSLGEYEIDFDPSLGYRYLRCTRFRSNGIVAQEILLSDYRDVDGYVMPFEIKESTFKSDGTLRKLEEISVKKADFDKPVMDEDFAIDVPAGTSLTCNVEGIQKHLRLENQESLTIESMIAKAAEYVADKRIYDSAKHPGKVPLGETKEEVTHNDKMSNTTNKSKNDESVVDPNQQDRNEISLIAQHGNSSKRKHLQITVIIVSIVGLVFAGYMVRWKIRKI
jgi:hypothetical protein